MEIYEHILANASNEFALGDSEIDDGSDKLEKQTKNEDLFDDSSELL